MSIKILFVRILMISEIMKQFREVTERVHIPTYPQYCKIHDVT